MGKLRTVPRDVHPHLMLSGQPTAKLSDLQRQAPSSLGRRYGHVIEKLRGLVYNNKLVHGVMSGTDLFGHKDPKKVKHYLVSIVICRHSTSEPCNGYWNCKAWAYNSLIANIPILKIQDVPYRNFDKADVVCVPVQGYQVDKDARFHRSWFVPGGMNKNGTCNNPTCVARKCDNYRNALDAMSEEEREASMKENFVDQITEAGGVGDEDDMDVTPPHRKKQDGKFRSGTTRRGKNKAGSDSEESERGLDGGEGQSGSDEEGRKNNSERESEEGSERKRPGRDKKKPRNTKRDRESESEDSSEGREGGPAKHKGRTKKRKPRNPKRDRKSEDSSEGREDGRGRDGTREGDHERERGRGRERAPPKKKKKQGKKRADEFSEEDDEESEDVKFSDFSTSEEGEQHSSGGELQDDAFNDSESDADQKKPATTKSGRNKQKLLQMQTHIISLNAERKKMKAKMEAVSQKCDAIVKTLKQFSSSMENTLRFLDSKVVMSSAARGDGHRSDADDEDDEEGRS